jgi:transposase
LGRELPGDGLSDLRTKGSSVLHFTLNQYKTSSLFVALLAALLQDYPEARVIHVILDNYKIHQSQMVQLVLCHFGKRIRLHFLPPYCPNENKIERIWQDLHAEVTRNHQRNSIEERMSDVWRFLSTRNRGHTTTLRRVAA